MTLWTANLFVCCVYQSSVLYPYTVYTEFLVPTAPCSVEDGYQSRILSSVLASFNSYYVMPVNVHTAGTVRYTASSLSTPVYFDMDISFLCCPCA
jgi:hypothetical protein